VTALVKYAALCVRKVAFDDRRLAVRFGNDEIARLNRLAVLLRGGNENELDGFGDGNSGRHVNEPAVEEERLVQRGKGVVIRQRATTELFFDEHRIRHQRRRQIRHFYPGRQSALGRERRRVISIHKNEPRAGQMGENIFPSAVLAAASFAGSVRAGAAARRAARRW
jgi:hypothetical protein